MTASAPCLVSGCRRQTPHPRLLCLDHWRRLPDSIRARITRHMMAGNRDSAVVVLMDFYAAEPKDGHVHAH